MESFEFLGGRYNRPEQIMSGPMQAFRAQNAATGKTVFIHRVSTTEAPEEQAALLKLLTTALVKSSDAKRLVLDFGEERGYWYVVTESEPQCALLREWLQLEIDSALANAGVTPANPVQTPDRPVTKVPSSPPTPPAESGDFTRFLKTRSPHSPQRSTPLAAQEPAPPNLATAAQMAETMAAPVKPPVAPSPPPPKEEPAMGEFTRVFQKANSTPPSSQTSAPPSPPLPQPAASGPGEFTSFFNAGQKSQEATPPPPQSPQRPFTPVSPPVEQPQGAGEFTRFFTGGLPPSPPKPSGQQAANPPFVQRPNTPIPQAPPVNPVVNPLPNQAAKPPENGEFTKLFARPANAPPVQRPRVPSYELPSKADGTDNIFNQNIDIPKPLASSKPPVGEFTQMFGGGGSAAPPVAPPAVVAQQQHKSLLEDAGQFAQPPPQAPRPPQPGQNMASAGPGEFTRMMQSPPKPVTESAAAGPVATPLAMPSLAVPKPGVPPLKLPAPAAVVVDAGKKKLAIFFSVLAALAVLLVLLMTFLMKK